MYITSIRKMSIFFSSFALIWSQWNEDRMKQHFRHVEVEKRNSLWWKAPNQGRLTGQWCAYENNPCPPKLQVRVILPSVSALCLSYLYMLHFSGLGTVRGNVSQLLVPRSSDKRPTGSTNLQLDYKTDASTHTHYQHLPQIWNWAFDQPL